MAIGASGDRIVALCTILALNQLNDRTLDYSLSWKMSEATIDGSQWDGELISDNIVNTSLEPTDSEIEATLRSGVVVHMNTRYAPTDPFLDTDIRGLKI